MSFRANILAIELEAQYDRRKRFLNDYIFYICNNVYIHIYVYVKWFNLSHLMAYLEEGGMIDN